MQQLPDTEGTFDPTLADVTEEWLELLSRLSVSVSITNTLLDTMQVMTLISDMTPVPTPWVCKFGHNLN